MALTDNWIDKVDGEDYVSADDINSVANAVIGNEKKINAINTEINGIPSKVENNTKKIEENSNEIEKISLRVSKNESKISTAPQIFSNSLVGSATGDGSVVLNDVSPVTHTIGVKVSSDTVTDLAAVKLAKSGKNFLPLLSEEKEHKFEGVIITRKKDGTLVINGTPEDNTWLQLYSSVSVKAGIKYTLSVGCEYFKNPDLSTAKGYIVCTNGTSTEQTTDAKLSKTFVATTNQLKNIGIVIFKGYTFNNVVVKPMVEVGEVVTEFESGTLKVGEVLTEYEVNADGTVDGVTSIYPTTTLLSDTNGVVIEANYNRNLNKAYDKIVSAIISLGGNV